MIGTSSNNFYHMQKDILKVKVSTLNKFEHSIQSISKTRKKITDNLKAYFEGVKMALNLNDPIPSKEIEVGIKMVECTN